MLVRFKVPSKWHRTLSCVLTVMLLPGAVAAQNAGEPWRVKMQSKPGEPMANTRVRLRLVQDALLVTRHGKEKLRIPLADILSAEFEPGSIPKTPADTHTSPPLCEGDYYDPRWRDHNVGREELIAAGVAIGILLLIVALNREEHQVVIRWRADGGQQELILKTRTEKKARRFLTELRNAMPPTARPEP